VAEQEARTKKLGTKAKKRPRIYLQVRAVIDKETGEERLALVAEDGIQRAAMKERGFKRGQRVACDVFPERCYSQWKQAHKLGTLLVLNVEGFENLDAHKALKKVQQEGDIECEHVTIDVPGFGPLRASTPRSLAFDEMGQDDFDRVFLAMCRFIGERYFNGLDESAILEMIELMPLDH